MTIEICVNIGSGNGFLPDGTKPLPKPALTHRQWDLVSFTSENFTPWYEFENCEFKITTASHKLKELTPVSEWVALKETEAETERVLRCHNIHAWFTVSCFNPLWFSDAIWRHRSRWAHVMSTCLTTPSHHMNQCWLLIKAVPWHSLEGNFTMSVPVTVQCNAPESYTVKPVYNDHLMGYFSASWSSSRWPRATYMSSTRQKLLARVIWYFQSSLKHITE